VFKYLQIYLNNPDKTQKGANKSLGVQIMGPDRAEKLNSDGYDGQNFRIFISPSPVASKPHHL